MLVYGCNLLTRTVSAACYYQSPSITTGLIELGSSMLISMFDVGHAS